MLIPVFFVISYIDSRKFQLSSQGVGYKVSYALIFFIVIFIIYKK